MLKRCLLAVIVALLVTSSQIAAAEDYDWSQAKRISNNAEFYRYVENGRRRGQTNFHVILTSISILPNAWRTGKISQYDIESIIPCHDVYRDSISAYTKDNCMYLTFRIIEYPGTKVANAYISGDKSKLTLEEEELYDIAVGIVYEANKLSSEREKARYIHKIICDRAYYPDDKSEITHENAIGAIVVGKTDCEGYTDAFYMLGRMCGLNVGRICGNLDNSVSGHAWNWITFSNGKSYCVDLTLDKSYDSYEWFLANFEVMKRHHSCEWSIIPNLQ